MRATDQYDHLFKKAIKDNLEQITGVSTGRLALLSDVATSAEVIAKINEIVVRLNHK